MASGEKQSSGTRSAKMNMLHFWPIRSLHFVIREVSATRRNLDVVQTCNRMTSGRQIQTDVPLFISPWVTCC